MAHQSSTDLSSSEKLDTDSSKTINDYEGEQTSKSDVFIDSSKDTSKHGGSLKSDLIQKEETSISSCVSLQKSLKTYNRSTMSACSANIMDVDCSAKESSKLDTEAHKDFVFVSIPSEISSKPEDFFKQNIGACEEETSKDTETEEDLETFECITMTDIETEIRDTFSQCVLTSPNKRTSKTSFNSNGPENENSSNTIVKENFQKSNTAVEGSKYYDVSKITSEQENVSETMIQEYSLFIHEVKYIPVLKELRKFHSNRYSKSTNPNELSENKTNETYLEDIYLPINNDVIEIPSSLISTTSKTSNFSSDVREPESTFSSSASCDPVDPQISAKEISSISSTSKSRSTPDHAVPGQKNVETSKKSLSILPPFSTLSKSSETFADGNQGHRLSSISSDELGVDPKTELDNQKEEFNEIHRWCSQNISEGKYVAKTFSLFKQLLKDLLELKSFLDGTGRASNDPADDPNYGLIIDEKLLASIADNFGTGIESLVAKNTRSMLATWLPPCPPLIESVAESSLDKGQVEIPVKPDRASELKVETSDQASSKESKNIQDSSSQPQLPKKPHLPRLHPGLEAISNPSDVSRQLLRLNRLSRRLLHGCIRAMKGVISYCFTHSYHLFLPSLEKLVGEIIDVLQSLASLRLECSRLLHRFYNKENSERVTYILKVKIHIAVAYNSLLKKILISNSRFYDACGLSLN